MKLDRRDMQILTLLEQDSTIKMAELARRISLSVTPTWQRVKRLEAAGVIAGYRARVDISRLPVRLTSIYVTMRLEDQRREALKKFEAAVTRLPELRSCHAIAGGTDYLVQFQVTDIAHYQQLMNGLLETSVGIKEYEAFVVTRSVADEPLCSGQLLDTNLARGATLQESAKEGVRGPRYPRRPCVATRQVERLAHES